MLRHLISAEHKKVSGERLFSTDFFYSKVLAYSAILKGTIDSGAMTRKVKVSVMKKVTSVLV